MCAIAVSIEMTKRSVLMLAAMALAGASCFGGTATFHCTGSGGGAVLVNTVVTLNNAVGNRLVPFLCSDASLGAVSLLGVSVTIYNDYTNADVPKASARLSTQRVSHTGKTPPRHGPAHFPAVTSAP